MALLISEIMFNPPGTDAPNEFVEIKGDASATIAAGTYLVCIEGDSGTGAGDVQNIFNLSGLTLGANGVLVFRQAGNTYTVDPQATVITGTGTGFGGIAAYSGDSGSTDIENTSVTFMLIQTATAPTLSNDIDSNGDGTADGSVFAGWTILDSVAVVDAAADTGYSPLVFAVSGAATAPGATIVDAGTSTPNYVARVNYAGSAAADWVAGGVEGTAPNFNLVSGQTTPASLGGRPIDDLGAPNSFAVVDNAPPQLTDTTPDDGATGVPLISDIVLTFNENVQAGAGGDITITNGTDTRTITVGAADPDGTVTFTNNTVTINPTANLQANSTYHVTFGATVIEDVNGNDFAGLAAGALDFTTGAEPFPGSTDINGIAILPEAPSLQGSATTPTATNTIKLLHVANIPPQGGSPGNAEVLSFDPVTDRLFILNATGNAIDVVQINPNGTRTAVGQIDLDAPATGLTDFGSANSVAVKNGVVAVAYGSATAGNPGHVALFDATTLAQLGNELQVGVLPDMVTFTPDGSKILVANEAEAVTAANNANGTISIISLAGGAASATVVTTIDFTALNGSESALDNELGLSLFNGTPASADIEPEYIAVSADGTTAYVTLQEVNAVAVIDLTNPSATKPVAILPLGSVDRSLTGNEFDPSDQDGGIHIGNFPVHSLLQPDAIATFTINGDTYFITANEGDARVGTPFSGEEVRLSSGSYDLDNTIFPNEGTLKDPANLGRLNVIAHEGNTDADPQIEVITTFGGRGFSIFRQNDDGTITKVRETGGEFERILAQENPALFNGENAPGTFDTRSDNKGPEPEGVDIGVINGRTYAFVALERAGGVMVYDVTDPAHAFFVDYQPPLAPGATPSPDNAPETVKFVSAADSPVGTPLVFTANEVGNSTAMYSVITPIYTIQGSGHFSTFDGDIVTTGGVVTAVDTNGSRGFWIQDPDGDGNDATSDGIFVFLGSSGTLPTVGDIVQVTGRVDEFTPSGAAIGSFSTTEITSVTSVISFGAAPDPIEATVIGPDGRVPPTESLIAGGLFYESLEGMLVRVQNPVAVGPTNSFGEIFTVVDDDHNPANGLHATGLTPGGNLLLTPGNPDFGDNDSSGGDYNPERIQIDDDNGVSAFVTPAVHVGAQLSDVTGVMTYDFGNYQVIATQPYTVANPSPKVKESTTLEGDANHLTIASYNAENLDPVVERREFVADGTDADTLGDLSNIDDDSARFAIIANEILNALNAPDIVALQEIQDNDGAEVSGTTSASLTLQTLVDAINAAAGPDGPHYAYVDNPFVEASANGGQPGGNIRVAFIYRTDRVDFVEGSEVTIAADGTAITSNGDQASNPNNPFHDSRPPLAATFVFNGQEVTVVNNHFTSKGGSGALLGADQPPFAAGEVQRAAQAQAVNSFVDNLLAEDAGAKVVVAGDLNEYPFEQPLSVLRGTAHISNYSVPGDDPFDAVADYTPGGTEILSDLMGLLPADQQYDYVFEGNSQTLDHLLATDGLMDGAQFDVVHINAEFSDQTTDHDPMVASFQIDEPNFVLQILHASDFEAGLDAIDRAGNFAAIVDYLEETYTNSITLSSGDNYLPSPFFNAGGDPSMEEVLETAYEQFYGLAPGTLNLAASVGRADISILNIIGVQASAIGNHEYDAGTREIQNIIARTNSIINPSVAGWIGAQFPYLSANTNFAGDSNLNPIFTSTIQDASIYNIPPGTNAGGTASAVNVNQDKIAPATIITENGERIGVVGATTQIVESISSTGGIDIIGDDINDMPQLAAILQPTIDALIAQGIDKIILVSHLQDLDFEQELAPLLSGVDIIIGGGSNTRLADGQDVLRPGDTAQGPYPIVTHDKDGNPLLIVNTDGEYSYVGRLVVEFDSQGHVVPGSVDPNVSGAFATTDEAVAALYEQGGVDVDHDGDVDANDADPFAEGSRGEIVQDIVDGVDAVIQAQDGNLFGRTDVYLEGRRTEVRSEETNLGNLSADANLWYAQQIDETVQVSIKNGGGIRDSIGRVEAVGGVSQELPPAANPDAGKEEGDVSQLDIANALRFNNGLSMLTITPAQLLEVLENGVSNPGSIFAQIGGVEFTYDSTLPANNRVLTVNLIDEDGNVTHTIVEDGEVVPGAPAQIRIVTLTFLIGAPDGAGGFQRPDGFRFAEYIAANAFANRVDLDGDASGNDDVATRTGAAMFTDNGREQDAFAEYMAANFSVTPYNEPDTTPQFDQRIRNVALNAPPVLAHDLEDQTSPVNQAFEFQFAPDDFTDADSTLTYSATLGDGSPLPVWLEFDPAFRTFSGTPPQNFVGDVTIKVTASDGVSEASDTFVLTISNEGNDVLVSGGPGETGEGEIFALNGGAGNDTYAVRDEEAVITEEEGGGTDTAYASVTYATSDNVEGLVLQESGEEIDGAGGENDDTIIGNSFANTLSGNGGSDNLIGNGGNDVLDGGAGVDGMAGGAGNDTYVVDNTFDQIQENPGEGTDTVYASASFTLFENLEGLVLLEGAGAIDGTGSEGNDTIFGNSESNTLDGRGGSDALTGGGGNDVLIGGAGVDGMAGGLGDDVYSVDNILDQIQENAGEGADTVYASATYTLAANVEALVLVDGAGAIDGTGNGDNNYLFGNASANTLHGGGGHDVLFGGGDADTLVGDAGNDVLVGGAGNDFFRFETGFGQDQVTDFTAGDRIVFSQAVFANFAAVQSHMSELDADTTLITFDSQNMVAVNHAPGVPLTQNDFLFV